VSPARRDTGASERLERLADAVGRWASGLGDADRGRPSGVAGLTVAELAAALASRAADPDPRLAEARGVLDALALGAAVPGSPPPAEQSAVAGAVRSSLAVLAERHPGHLVEARVPPSGAVQIGVPGVASVHRRGTPPNVVECSPDTWLALALGRLSWSDAVAAGRVSAGGAHAQLGDLLPLA